ncbi:MAG: hypothetical protein ABJA34_07615 [Pseudonocardiales bacterium]
MRSERGDVILGWLTKLALALAVVGLLGFDGASLLRTTFRASDTADRAAAEAIDAWTVTKDVQSAYAAAQASTLTSGGAVPRKSFAINADSSVHLQVRETAPTFVLHHIGLLRHIAIIISAGTARPPT